MNKILLLSLIIILSSCSKEDPASPVTFVQPKVGSTYTYDEYATDTTSGMPIASTRDTSVTTFTKVGTSYMGKSNVSEVSIVNNNGTAINHVNYESSGDVSLFMSGEGISKWLLLPVSSKSTQSVTLADTTVEVYGVSIRTMISVTTSYLGTESMSVKGQTLSVVKLQQSITSKTTIDTNTTTNTAKNFVYYAPSNGFIAKTESPMSVSPFDGTKQSGQISTLIDFILK